MNLWFMTMCSTIKGRWINQSAVLQNKEDSPLIVFAVSMECDSFEKSIDERQYFDIYSNETRRFQRTLHHTSCRTPYYGNIIELIQEIPVCGDRRVSECSVCLLEYGTAECSPGSMCQSTFKGHFQSPDFKAVISNISELNVATRIHARR